MTEQILNALRDLKERLSASLISDGEFQLAITAVLNRALTAGGRIRLVLKDKQQRTLHIYLPSDNVSPSQDPERSNSEGQESAVEYTIEASFEPGSPLKGEKSNLFRQLGDALDLHWSHRDTLSLLPRAQDAGLDILALNHLRKVADEYSSVGLLQLDLDSFGELNKSEKGGSSILGDAVLREFATRVREHFSSIGIVLRSGTGDEFSAVLSAQDSSTIVLAVEKFRSNMANTPFTAINEANNHSFSAIKTCSIGLVVYIDPNELSRFSSFLAAFKTPGEALLRAKTEGKNCIRLSAKPSSLTMVAVSAVDLGRAALVARCGIHQEKLTAFHNPFSNAVGDILVACFAESSLTNYLQVAPAICATLGIDIVETPSEAATVLVPEIGSAEWLGLCARGLLRSTYLGRALVAEDEKISLHSAASQTAIRISRAGGVIGEGVVSQKMSSAPPAEVEVGEPWFDGTGSATAVRRFVGRAGVSGTDAGALSPCLLLPIGDEAVELSKQYGPLVASVVEVDDRPVTGGGLPDFWQSNIARVVRACLANPNIETVVAVGNTTQAEATLGGLRSDASIWSDLPSLARRLGIQQSDLARFVARSIIVETTDPGESNLIGALLAATQNLRNRDLSAAEAIDISYISARRRHMRLSQSDADAGRLLREDGLRARTLSEAYPRVIQTFREYSQHLQQEPSGREFKEFSCFKVHLTQAQLDLVPDYWEAEKASLEDYFNRNFVMANGIFAKRLNHKVGNQSVAEAAIAATVSAIMDAKPTRRILLPIAQVAESLEDVTHPLGLTAVQILPRIRAGRIVVDFTWIWRTVEVLVGFPFSAYGSIRYSEHYLERVKTGLGGWAAGKAIEFGDLNYVALSLHMFQDVGDLEIARAIIVDAAD